MDIRELNRIDPLGRQPETGSIGETLSPMAPPEAFAPPALDSVRVEDMHPVLKEFVAEHVAFEKYLKSLEEAVLEIQGNGLSKASDRKIRDFFYFFDHVFVPHSRREERVLFPLLNERLMAAGEHSKGSVPTTSIDLMEDDHNKAVQMAAVVFNFFALALRLPDDRSRLIVLDAALEQAKNLIELLRIHIYREDNVLFTSAHRLISRSEFDTMFTKSVQ